ncbi:O-methyltransferase [Candidatus Spongiisocius sp.]|uniref:O-methyltransferase n=1 Tax=Candidatus Spongiisocius sp. TaxID=3101273 RepID=UPI003B5C0A55
MSYDLRPAKQTERRILLDLVALGRACGLEISSYRYVGMGGNRFYDYLLLHRYLGIHNMVSLEHDPNMVERARFNAPYGFIDVREQSTTDFIQLDEFDVNSIYWFDYDGAIGTEVIADIYSLGTAVSAGDFIFVTVNGRPPRVIRKMSSHQRADWYTATFGDVANQIQPNECEDGTFNKSVHKLLRTAFRHAFASAADVFSMPLQIFYRDSTQMVTVGGCYLQAEDDEKYRRRCEQELPFLDVKSNAPYSIPHLSLSERERQVFDLAATGRSEAFNRLKAMGFDDRDVECHRELIRYIPRYVETIV